MPGIFILVVAKAKLESCSQYIPDTLAEYTLNLLILSAIISNTL